MPLRIGIGHIKLASPLTNQEMKYLQTVNLSAGVENDITTTLVSEPYNIFLLDSSGNDITDDVGPRRLGIVGGFYHVYIYSTDVLAGVKLKILY
jgi:hypothetical protein